MKAFEKWMAKPENDLLTIRNNLAAAKVPFAACCFHAQQAAEKYLKAFLLSKGFPFPKIHDLIALNNWCIGIDSTFEQISEVALRLTDYGIAPRYPDALGDLHLEDAKQAFQEALIIKNFVL